MYSKIKLIMQQVSACDCNDDEGLDADNYLGLRFHVFYCCSLITNYEFSVYVDSSHAYFRRQKCSLQTHRLWHEKPAP